MSPDIDCQILGLEPDASLDEIKEAYRCKIKILHPDRYENDPATQKQATEKLKLINDAYARLRSNCS